MAVSNIARMYEAGKYKGWAGQELAREQWSILKNSPSFKPFQLVGRLAKSERKAFLYQVVRKVLNRDIINIAQLIGDCVSWGMRNSLEYLICCDILMRGDREMYRPIFAPYLYGTGRVFIGKGQLDRQGDGSLGSWMADAVIKYGALASDESGVPEYSASVAKKYGNSPGPPKNFVDVAQKFLVKSAARVSSWNQLVEGIVNGYTATVASNQGFQMMPNSKGFHEPSGNWAHQMAVTGIDDEYVTPYCFIRNSWGEDAHGQLTNFYDPTEKVPAGYLRVRKQIMEDMIGDGEVFLISNFNGFPAQDIPRALFNFIN